MCAHYRRALLGRHQRPQHRPYLARGCRRRNIGKIVDGDIIDIDIPNRSINVRLTEAELAARPQRPMTRRRTVSKALKAYAQSVSSADKGGVRIIED